MALTHSHTHTLAHQQQPRTWTRHTLLTGRPATRPPALPRHTGVRRWRQCVRSWRRVSLFWGPRRWRTSCRRVCDGSEAGSVQVCCVGRRGSSAGPPAPRHNVPRREHTRAPHRCRHAAAAVRGHTPAWAPAMPLPARTPTPHRAPPHDTAACTRNRQYARAHTHDPSLLASPPPHTPLKHTRTHTRAAGGRARGRGSAGCCRHPRVGAHGGQDGDGHQHRAHGAVRRARAALRGAAAGRVRRVRRSARHTCRDTHRAL
jgi:hypothetical protein